MELGRKQEASNLLQRDTDREIIEHICEYLSVMADEPAESLISLKSIYNDIRRIIGNACEEKSQSQTYTQGGTLPKGWN